MKGVGLGEDGKEETEVEGEHGDVEGEIEKTFRQGKMENMDADRGIFLVLPLL